MPDFYQQPDYLKDLYNKPTPNSAQPTQPQGTPNPVPAQTYPAQAPTQVSPVQQNVPVQPSVPAQPNVGVQQPPKPLEPTMPPAPPTPPTIQPVIPEEAPKKPARRKLFVIIGAVVVAVVVVLLILMLLTRGSGSTPQKDKVVLQWWGAFLDTEVVQPLIDQYQAQNTNVTIEYANRFKSTEPYDDEVVRYQEDLNRVLSAGNQVEIPDIFMVDSTWVGDYEKFVKASNSYDITTYKNTFYDVVSTNFTQGNSIYGVPLWVDTYAVVYNKKLLSQASLSTPPTTWANFKTVAQQLTKRNGNTITQAGFAAGSATNTDYASSVYQILMLQNGVTLANSKGVPQFATDPDSLTALTFYKGFIDSSSGTWNKAMNNESAAFLDGEVAMIVVPSYRLREILAFNDKYSLGLEIGIAPMPQVDGSTTEYNFGTYWGNMVASNRPNSTEAWKFLKWMTESTQLQTLSDNVKEHNKYFGTISPRKDMNTELVSDEYLRVYNEDVLIAQSWYMIKGLGVTDLFNELIDQTSTSASQIETTQKDIIKLQSNQGKL